MKLIGRTALIAVLCVSFWSCRKDRIRHGGIYTGGVAFTFDDYDVDNWYQYLPLMDSFGVKATFYISNYKKLNLSQKKKLREIEQRGHEIAFHSTNHYNMKQYLNTSGMEKLIRSEIKVGLDRMNHDGFYPKTFAYPYGQHTPALDNELLKYFKSVRALNGTNNLARSIVSSCNNDLIYGLGIDESSNRSIDDLLKLVNNAKTGRGCLVLVVHHVEIPQTKLQLPVDKLRMLFKEAHALNLKFYRVSEISE